MKKLIAILITPTLPLAASPNPSALSALFENAPRHEAVMAPAVKVQESTYQKLTNPESKAASRPSKWVHHKDEMYYSFGIGSTALFTPARYIHAYLSAATSNLFATILLAPLFVLLAPAAFLAGCATSFAAEGQYLPSWTVLDVQ